MENNARWDPGTYLIDVYADWREKSAAVDDAYWRWSSAPEPDRALRFAAYQATLDREEQASIVYRNRLRRISSLEARVPPQAAALGRAGTRSSSR